MQYIWEAALAAGKSGIKHTDLLYQEAKVWSPYLEVSFCDLNMEAVEQNIVEVNPFYRFSDIFDGILDINLKEYEKTREIFVDAVFHYLTITDLRMGMSKKDYYFRFLTDELENGEFGYKAQKAMGLFSAQEKKYIILALLDYVASHNYLETFKRLFGEIYRDSVIYVSTDRANEFYIYVGKAESEDEQDRVRFLLDTFLPIGMQTEIFYSEHFGIVDVGETMVLDQLLLI